MRVAIAGLGPIGKWAVQAVVADPSLELVAAADSAADLAGRSLAALVEGAPDLLVAGSIRVAIEVRPTVLLHCAGSRLDAIADDLEDCVRRGVSVVSSSEELACPQRTHPRLAARLDDACRAGGGRLIGTGVDPGLVLDVLPALLASGSLGVRRIRAVRIVDSTTRRPQLRRKTGCGLTAEQFARGVDERRLGHVGLAGSAHLVATALGWSGEVTESIAPRLAARDVATAEGVCAAGRVAGIEQVASLQVGGDERIRLELVIAAGEAEPVDAVEIEGQPSFSARIVGGIAGEPATVARLLAAIRPLLATPPGLRTVLDLPLAASA